MSKPIARVAPLVVALLAIPVLCAAAAGGGAGQAATTLYSANTLVWQPLIAYRTASVRVAIKARLGL